LNIEWLIPCRFVEVHDNVATIVGAGIDTHWLPGLPGQVQVTLAIRVVGLQEEFDESITHTTAARIRNPGGDTINEISGSFQIGATSARPEFLVGVTLPAVLTFDVDTEGTYTIEFEVDDATRAIPVHVVRGTP
jgi:hypothetical protein